MNRQNKFIVFFMTLSLPALVFSASVYETQADFLSRAFNDSPPEPGILWLSGDRRPAVRQILGHDYPALRLRYWCQDERSAWVLEEIGKELPITVGIIIENNYIRNLQVLTYRENRGGEVATPAFTDQFNDAELEMNNKLDVTIDSISGATLSVQALTRLAKMALFLNTKSNCNDGS
ncbi:MAG: FMN-binding protein [Xanthomonadales bacterium]|nr:FMN-binding protein [Xanthomonadales bacterium]